MATQLRIPIGRKGRTINADYMPVRRINIHTLGWACVRDDAEGVLLRFPAIICATNPDILTASDWQGAHEHRDLSDPQDLSDVRFYTPRTGSISHVGNRFGSAYWHGELPRVPAYWPPPLPWIKVGSEYVATGLPRMPAPWPPTQGARQP